MQHKKRKKIYSEQLLQIHEDSKKIHPGKEIYATGYVIELKKIVILQAFRMEKFCAAHLSMPVIFLTPTVRNSL